MQSSTRILFLPKLRILAGELAGPEEPRALIQAAIVVPLTAGPCHYAVAGAETAIDADHALLINPMTEHVRLGAAERCATLVALLSADWVAARVAGKRGVQATRPFPATVVPQTPSFRQRLDALLARLRDPAASDADLTAAAEAYAQETLDIYTGPAETSGPAFDYRIRRAIQTIGVDPAKPPSVDDLIAASDLSRSRFFQLFRECTGLTPQMYIDAHAIEAALDALTRGGKPVARIAREAGLGSPERFARYVKRMTGLGPREFRRAALRLDGAKPDVAHYGAPSSATVSPA
jgi:AraC family transcriptional regulator